MFNDDLGARNATASSAVGVPRTLTRLATRALQSSRAVSPPTPTPELRRRIAALAEDGTPLPVVHW